MNPEEEGASESIYRKAEQSDLQNIHIHEEAPADLRNSAVGDKKSASPSPLQKMSNSYEDDYQLDRGGTGSTQATAQQNAS